MIPEAAAEQAARMIEPGQVVGLGTGRAAEAFLRALGRRVAEGLNVRGVASSRAIEALAATAGVPLVEFDDVETIDIAVDGADEIDPQLNLIKGLGGALLREKVIAASARTYVIVAGSEKRVECLGRRGNLPVEVVPFAREFARRRLEDLGLVAEVRRVDGVDFETDNGNAVLDCRTGLIADAPGLQRQIRAIPGVVDCGLFLGLANHALIQHGAEVEAITAPVGGR